MALFKTFVLDLKIIVEYNYLLCFPFIFFTEVSDLMSSVITLKVLWFNLILDFNFSFLCLWHSCVGKVPFSDCIKFFFSSTKRGYKCTLVQSKNCFNLQYRQSSVEKSIFIELQEVIHDLDIWHKSAKVVKALTDVS